MNELNSLKRWFLLEEVAQQLTSLTAKNVAVADVLRLALDAHLKLSLRLIGPVKARPGYRVPTEEESLAFMVEVAESTEPLKVISRGQLGGECITLAAPVSGEVASEFALHQGDYDDDDSYGTEIGLIVESYVVTLDGVVDLVLLSDGRRVVEDMHQALIGLPQASPCFDKGVYFAGQGRAIYQLQEPFSEIVSEGRQLARAANLRHYIEDNNFSAEQAKKYLAKEADRRQAHLRHQKQTPTTLKYMPASTLPLDSVLVVRAESLATFLVKMNLNFNAANVGVLSAAPGSPPLLDAEQEFPSILVEQRRDEAEDLRNGTLDNWKIRIQAEATRMILSGREQGAQPKPFSIINDLARWCVKNNVVTPTGVHPAAGYIRTHVLSGNHWKAP